MRKVGLLESTGKTVRWIYEFMFSMNISWLIVWFERQRGSPNRIPLVGQPINSYIHRLYGGSHMIEPQSTLDQVIWSLLVALCIFLLLRLLARFSPTSIFLRTLAGAVSLAGLSLSVLFWPGLFLEPHHSSGPYAYKGPFVVDERWLIVEVMIVLACGFAYYLRAWPVPASLSIILLFYIFRL